jgi:hypothetical protein
MPLRLEAARRVRVAEAVHVDRLNADSRTAVPSVAGADAVSCVFFTVAPFVQGEVLAAHDGEFYCWGFVLIDRVVSSLDPRSPAI